MAKRDGWSKYYLYKMLFNKVSDGFFEDPFTQVIFDVERGEYMLSVRYRTPRRALHAFVDVINLEETPGEAFKRYANVMLEGVYGEK